MIVLVILFLVFLCIPLLPLAIGYFAKQPEIDSLKIDAHESYRMVSLESSPSELIKGRSEFVKILYFLSGVLLVLVGLPLLGFAFGLASFSGWVGFLIVMVPYAALTWWWLRHVVSVVGDV